MEEAGHKRKKTLKSLKSFITKFWFDWFGDITQKVSKILFSKKSKKIFRFFITFEILSIILYIVWDFSDPGITFYGNPILQIQFNAAVLLIFSSIIGLIFHLLIKKIKGINKFYKIQHYSMITVFLIPCIWFIFIIWARWVAPEVWRDMDENKPSKSETVELAPKTAGKKGGSLILDAASYISHENGFAINFPTNEIDINSIDEYSRVFTCVEEVGDDYIFYQIQIMDERPGSPLKFDTKELHHAFLNQFLRSAQVLYDNPLNIYTDISLYKNKYYSLNYKFSGFWQIAEPGLPVYNMGIVIMHNRRLKRVLCIYSKNLETGTYVKKKFKKFVGSLHLLD